MLDGAVYRYEHVFQVFPSASLDVFRVHDLHTETNAPLMKVNIYTSQRTSTVQYQHVFQGYMELVSC